MKRFRFTWYDGREDEADGETPEAAIKNLGYGPVLSLAKSFVDITPVSYAVRCDSERRLRESFALSHEAYADVLDRKEPQKPNDLVYLRHYVAWRNLANWPEDICEPE